MLPAAAGWSPGTNPGPPRQPPRGPTAAAAAGWSRGSNPGPPSGPPPPAPLPRERPARPPPASIVSVPLTDDAGNVIEARLEELQDRVAGIVQVWHLQL